MATSLMRVDVQVSGFREARARLRETPPFYSPAARNLLDHLGRIGVAAVRGASPRGATGRLQGGTIYQVQKKPFPTWVRVKNTTRARGRVAKRQSKKARAGLAPLRYTKGYPYGGRLNYDAKYRTHLWWTKAIRAAQARTDSLLAGSAREIEEEWGRT